VREAVFNALESLGALEGAVVVDLFAGSGALGIEALSRGASHCTFVESGAAALRALRANVEACGFGVRADVVACDALTFATRRITADVVLADPPYSFDRWPELLAAVQARLAVLESDRPVEPGPGWVVSRLKRYGGTVVTFVVRDDRQATE